MQSTKLGWPDAVGSAVLRAGFQKPRSPCVGLPEGLVAVASERRVGAGEAAAAVRQRLRELEAEVATLQRELDDGDEAQSPACDF